MRRSAWKQCRSCSRGLATRCGATRWRDGRWRGGCARPPPRSTRVTGSCASQSISQVRVQAAQLAGDRHVALGVAEPDRRGDVQSARGRPSGRYTVGSRGVRGRPKASSENSRSAQVDLDRLAGVREVAGARDRLELAAGERGASARPSRGGVILSRSPWTHQHRAVQVLRQRAQRPPVAVGLRRRRGRDQRLGVGVERPSDAVLDPPWSSAARGSLRETNHSTNPGSPRASGRRCSVAHQRRRASGRRRAASTAGSSSSDQCDGV